MDFTAFGLIGLFAGTALSATIIPLASEAMLIGVYELGYPVILSLLIATAGNSLGGVTNYMIGLAANREKLERRYKLSGPKLLKWEKRFRKHGFYLGLLAWIPFVGDPMTIALGFFKVPFWPLFFTMLIGRFTRYCVITFIYLSM